MRTLAERARGLKLRLVAMTDEARGGDPRLVASHLPAGAWLIFRHYGVPDRSVLAMQVAKICRQRRVGLLIAGDPQLAARLKAGLHLPDRPGRPIGWRGLLTIAAHDRRGLLRAAKLRADAALLSPVFPTLSHPDAKPLGLLALRRLARGAGAPVLALGGITAERLPALKNTGILGIAGVGGFTPPGKARPRPPPA
jgi:thiamine-phosphate pyrophosphorylase